MALMSEQPKHERDEFDGSDLFDFIKLLRRESRLIALTALVVGLAAFFYSYNQPKVYEAVTSLEYDPNPPRPMGASVEDVTDEVTGYWSTKEFYETQNRILRSRTLAEEVVRKLELHENLEFIAFHPRPKADVEPISVEAAADLLRTRLRVNQVRDSRIVELRVRDTDPVRSATISNSIAEAFIERTLADRLSTTSAALEWLEEQLAELREEVQGAEHELHRFKLDHNILSISLEDRQNVIARTIEQVNTSLTETRTRRIELSARLAQLKAAVKESPLVAATRLLNDDPAIAATRAKLSERVAEEASLSERYGENHPQRIAINAEIAKLTQNLEQNIARVVRATEAELEETRRTEAGLKSALDEAHSAGLELNLHELNYLRLTRDYENNVELYKSLLERAAQTKLNRLVHVARARLVDHALPPERSVEPRVLMSAFMGLIFGFALGLIFAVIRLRMDRTIRTAADLEAIGVPFLGVLPKIDAADSGLRAPKSLRRVLGDGGQPAQVAGKASDKLAAEDRALTVLRSPRSIAAECSRAIRTNIAFMSPEDPIRSLVVTSQRPQEGKTTVVVSLALSMADSGKSVLLIDGDLRRPRLHRIFGLSEQRGFSNILAGHGTLADSAHTTEAPLLKVLPAGPIPPNPSELLHGERFAEFMREALEAFDFVIFDSPPLGAVTDAAILAHHVDGAIAVARASSTPIAALRATIKRIADVDARLLGCVLNDVDFKSERYEGETYPYYVYSYYGEDEGEATRGKSSKTKAAG